MPNTYAKVREIGRGGFGIVDEVTNDVGKSLARKTLNVPAHLDPADVRARFEREIKYQSAVNHENVVPILDYDLDADPPWFVMPLAECSLADELSADHSLNGQPKKALFDILAGLEEVHRRAYVHRDLKPANVLKIRDDHGQERYAISDFGLMTLDQGGISSLTPSNMGGGTPMYRPPECAINFKRAVIQSDVYSFGAILHDIFCHQNKRLPHDELSGPPPIGPVIERCTKRNAHRRYAGVPDLRDALFEVLDDYEFTFESGEEKAVFDLLADSTLPNGEQWDRIFAFLDENESNDAAIGNIFRGLRAEHIDQLSQEEPTLLSALGKMYCEFVRVGNFDFDYCDVLADKVQRFYDLGGVDLKSAAAISLLVMGTAHNRWYVERKFLRMAGPETDDVLAERIAVEVDVLKVDFNRRFEHLGWSVSAKPTDLHPVLRGLIANDPNG